MAQNYNSLVILKLLYFGGWKILWLPFYLFFLSASPTKSNGNFQASWQNWFRKLKICSGQYEPEVSLTTRLNIALKTFHLKLKVIKLCGITSWKPLWNFSVWWKSTLQLHTIVLSDLSYLNHCLYKNINCRK